MSYLAFCGRFCTNGIEGDKKSELQVELPKVSEVVQEQAQVIRESEREISPQNIILEEIEDVQIFPNKILHQAEIIPEKQKEVIPSTEQAIPLTTEASSHGLEDIDINFVREFFNIPISENIANNYNILEKMNIPASTDFDTGRKDLHVKKVKIEGPFKGEGCLYEKMKIQVAHKPEENYSYENVESINIGDIPGKKSNAYLYKKKIGSTKKQQPSAQQNENVNTTNIPTTDIKAKAKMEKKDLKQHLQETKKSMSANTSELVQERSISLDLSASKKQKTSKNSLLSKFPKLKIERVNSLYIQQNLPHIDASPISTPLLDKHSCSYCEEIYKDAILNNAPLLSHKCPFCQNFINDDSVDFYIKKYKDDILRLKRNSIKIKDQHQKEQSINVVKANNIININLKEEDKYEKNKNLPISEVIKEKRNKLLENFEKRKSLNLEEEKTKLENKFKIGAGIKDKPNLKKLLASIKTRIKTPVKRESVPAKKSSEPSIESKLKKPYKELEKDKPFSKLLKAFPELEKNISRSVSKSESEDLTKRKERLKNYAKKLSDSVLKRSSININVKTSRDSKASNTNIKTSKSARSSKTAKAEIKL